MANTTVTYFPAPSGAVASNDYSNVLTVASQTIEITTLNGDVDGAYLVRGYLVHAAATGNSNWQFRMNQQTSNMNSTSFDFAHAQTLNQSSWTIANSSAYPFANSTTWNFTGILYAKSGKTRIWSMPLPQGLTGDVNHTSFAMYGEWTDTTHVLTAFGLQSSVAADFAIGSALYMTPLNIQF